MPLSSENRSSGSSLLIVGIALTFLGVALIALFGDRSGLALGAAVGLAVVGLGVLLRSILTAGTS